MITCEHNIQLFYLKVRLYDELLTTNGVLGRVEGQSLSQRAVSALKGVDVNTADFITHLSSLTFIFP